MQAFFERALEARLKRVFICGSAGAPDNRRMQAPHRSAAKPGSAAPGRCLRAALAGLLSFGLIWPRARSGGPDERERGRDHDRARTAVQAGEALPLNAVLERLQRTHPGRVLEVELERDDGRWVYEIKLLQPDGGLLKLELDARTAQVLEVKRRDKRKSEDRP